MKALRLSESHKMTWEVELPDGTTYELTTSSFNNTKKLKEMSDNLQQATRDDTAIELCYEFAAELFSSNRRNKPVTADELKEHGMTYGDLVEFFYGYAEWMNEIRQRKN